MLVVGLGNPGPDYQHTRHNVGWMLLDRLATDLGAAFGRSPWESQAADATVGQSKVCLLKPLTFMNLSGRAIAPAARDLRIGADRVVVVSDEVQLPVGKLKLTTGGSDGGHNGLASAIHELGTDKFRRLRIGVGQGPPGQMRDWVLAPFAADEQGLLSETLELAVEAILTFVRLGGSESAWLKASADSNAKRRQPLEIQMATRRAQEAAEQAAATSAAAAKPASIDAEGEKSPESTGE